MTNDQKTQLMELEAKVAQAMSILLEVDQSIKAMKPKVKRRSVSDRDIQNQFKRIMEAGKWT